MKLLRHTAKEKGMCLNEYGMGDKVCAVRELRNTDLTDSRRRSSTQKTM